MPKVAETKKGEHGGCLVTGHLLNAAGQPATNFVRVRPERAVLHNGILYPANWSTVQVRGDGVFEAVLLPSSLVGDYQVQIGKETLRMVVPDARQADFGDILKG